MELLYNEGPRDWQNLACAITRFRYIEDYRGSFSYILLLLGQRKSFVIPRASLYMVRYIEVPLYLILASFSDLLLKRHQAKWNLFALYKEEKGCSKITTV